MEANSKQTSVDNQQAIQEQPVELIDSGGADQAEPENSINWNSPKEASVDNQQAIQEQSVELCDGGGSHQIKPENSINLNAPKEASVDNQAIQGQPVQLIDSGEAYQGEPENSIYWSFLKDTAVDNQQAKQAQPFELVAGGGAHQDEPESWSAFIPKETKVSTCLLTDKNELLISILSRINIGYIKASFDIFWIPVSFLNIDLVKLSWISVGWGWRFWG